MTLKLTDSQYNRLS